MLHIPATTELVIFDMDGLLINSEPFWKQAEKEVFGELGITLTDDLLRQVMGFRLNEVVQHWYNFQPWPNPDFILTEKTVLDTVKHLIANHADAMPGVHQILAALHKKGIRMALASSSYMELIDLVTDKLGIKSYFEYIRSAQNEPYGKPHPGIFLSVAQWCKVNPLHCVVIEDAVNGVIAAKAARMFCIAIPDEASFNDKRFSLADMKLKSLADIKV